MAAMADTMTESAFLAWSVPVHYSELGALIETYAIWTKPAMITFRICQQYAREDTAFRRLPSELVEEIIGLIRHYICPQRSEAWSEMGVDLNMATYKSPNLAEYTREPNPQFRASDDPDIQVLECRALTVGLMSKLEGTSARTQCGKRFAKMQQVCWNRSRQPQKKVFHKLTMVLDL